MPFRSVVWIRQITNYRTETGISSLFDLITGVVLLPLGCASAQERKAEAEARWYEERVKLVKEYKDCVAKHDGDTAPCQYLLDLMKNMESK